MNWKLFSKFGSDLDASTKLTIERGRRNMEILKQPQYEPVPVEEQVAILTASTRGFLDKVPVEKVKEFEKDFLGLLRVQHKNILDNFKAGKVEDADVAMIKKLASELSSKY